MASVILNSHPESYDDPRLAVLVQEIDDVGIEDCICAIRLGAGQRIAIEGEDCTFVATGPGVMFVAILPMEAFEGGEQ